MVTANRVDSCSWVQRVRNVKQGADYELIPAPIPSSTLLPPPLAFTLPGCLSRSDSARPCCVGAGRPFSIIPAVLGCEVGCYVGQCRINEIFLKNIQTHNCKGHLHHDISADAYFFKCIIMSLWEFKRNIYRFEH